MRRFEGRPGGRELAVFAVCGVLLAVVVGPAASETEAGARAWPRVSISDGFTAAAVRSALDGASRRLADARCQVIFSDFRDQAGRPLLEKLADLGQTGQSYLGLVLFRDGSDYARCRYEGTLAITGPGHRVVYVCGRQFGRLWASQRHYAEAVLIHELLHTLGLGENPPSSLEITRQVLRRCGR